MTVNWSRVCAQKSYGGPQVTNILVENNAFLIKLAWDFAYSDFAELELMRKRFLKLKYKKCVVYHFSLIWPKI